MRFSLSMLFFALIAFTNPTLSYAKDDNNALNKKQASGVGTINNNKKSSEKKKLTKTEGKVPEYKKAQKEDIEN